MEQISLPAYQSLNESFRKTLVFRIGIDCGLFVELNYMVNAMAFCLVKGIRFQLYSDGANFSTTRGWTEYFLPFCTEVHEPFHQRYNLHRPPSWGRILRTAARERSSRFIRWKLKVVGKTFLGHLLARLAYGRHTLLSQDVLPLADRHYTIPQLGLSCDHDRLYSLLARMVWRLQPAIVQTMEHQKSRWQMPPSYFGLQIRGGDKASEAQLINGRRIISSLHPQNGDDIFILTDDYRLYQQSCRHFPGLRLLTLCQPRECGYVHTEFVKSAPSEKHDAVVRLLISVDLLLHSCSFVGSITTGPSVFVMKMRCDDFFVCAVDCPKERLKSALRLTIKERADISRHYLPEHC